VKQKEATSESETTVNRWRFSWKNMVVSAGKHVTKHRRKCRMS